VSFPVENPYRGGRLRFASRTGKRAAFNCRSIQLRAESATRAQVIAVKAGRFIETVITQ
jgi:hypothetical protein